MSELLSPYEVLNIAQTIEENGANFYREAARLHPEAADTRFLLQLAAMEEDHKKTFETMQKGLVSDEKPDDDLFSSVDRYLKAVSDSASLEGSIFASFLFTGDETLSDIVLVGIDLEKETIINEEKKHISTLAEEYRKLKANE